MPKEIMDEPTDMDADSSTAPALDEATDTAATEGAEPDATADSSAATDETEAGSLSVVRDVVAEREDQQAAAAPSAEGEEGTGDELPAGEEDDYSNVPFNSHPRFRKLLDERNSFKHGADQYQKVTAYLDQMNLTGNEAADVMGYAGRAKTDPVGVWNDAQFQTWLKALAEGAGVILPADLEQQVTEGKLTREAASQISVARAQVRSAEVRQNFERERGTRQQQTQLGATLRETANSWLGQRRLKDPNFAAKEARLHERIVFLQSTEGKPNTADGVKAQLKKAYEHVNKELGSRPAAPAPANANSAPAPARRPAIKPVTGGQVASNAQASAPKTTLDVIRQQRAKRTA